MLTSARTIITAFRRCRWDSALYRAAAAEVIKEISTKSLKELIAALILSEYYMMDTDRIRSLIIAIHHGHSGKINPSRLLGEITDNDHSTNSLLYIRTIEAVREMKTEADLETVVATLLMKYFE